MSISCKLENGKKSIQHAKAMSLASDKTVDPVPERKKDPETGRFIHNSISGNRIMVKGGTNAPYRIAKHKRNQAGGQKNQSNRNKNITKRKM